MKLPPTKLVLTCSGNIADEDLKERLLKIKATLEDLSQIKEHSVNLSKVEPWNSVRVTFNIPQEAAARLRELAQRGDPNLHKLGILTIQVENGETISLPPPPPEAQRSLFSPPPPTPSGTPQLPPGPPLVPPSPTPVSSPVIPVSTPTPGTMVPGHGLPGSVTAPNFAVPGVSLQQLTRPSLQGLQAQGAAPLFSQQGTGNLWNSMGVSQQRPLQPPASFWNQIPQFFPQVGVTQANQPPQVMPSGPQIPPVSQPKPQPKKRRKRTKKSNIQPPELAVAAGQPLLPLPPQLPPLPTSNTNTQDNADNLSTNKPSNLTLPPSLIDNPISPNTPPSTAMSTNVSTTAPVVASSASSGTQFSFTDVPMSRGLVPSPQTQQQQQLQQQLLQKKTDVALTSPLLVNLLQSDISAKQFPFSNSSGSKTTSTGTDTPTTAQPGPPSQDTVIASSAPGINTSSPFMIGNGIGTLTASNSAIPNISPFVTSQGNVPGFISTAGQIIPPNTLLPAQSGQLSQEQLQFQLSQLSAAQLSQVQAQHAQSFPSHLPQTPVVPGQNQVPPSNMQSFQMPGGHQLQGQLFPGPMPPTQLPNARMSVGPIATPDPMSQSQMRLGGPMYMGHIPRAPMPSDRTQVSPSDSSASQSKGQLLVHPVGQLHPTSAPFTSTSSTPVPPPVNPLDTWNAAPCPSVVKEKQELHVDPQAKKVEQPGVSDAGASQPKSNLEKNGEDSKKSTVPEPAEEDGHVFDEEAALLGMTEAERATMAVAAIIAKEAKMAADAKSGKAQQSKETPPPKSEPQLSPITSTPASTVASSDGIPAISHQQPTSTPNVPSTRTFQETQFSRPTSRGGPSVPPVAERRSANSPIRLSPPKIPEGLKQRRTPPSSTSRPVHTQQQPQYGPIPGSSPSSMSSGIAGLQTLTSRTFSAAGQPSIRDMALSRNTEHNTLSQFLSSVTPPTEILQMAPLFRSNKQQEVPPKSTQGFLSGPTAVSTDWLSLPSVDTPKPLPLPAQIGARTPMQPAEFSAATERMLGSMLDTQKPSIGNIERPPNQPRVITTEGINFMHKLVGRAPPSNPQSQPPQKDAPAAKSNSDDQTIFSDQTKKEDKSQLKALLNEIVIPEKGSFEKQLLSVDSKAEKPQVTLASTSSDSLRQSSTFSPTTSHQMDSWLGLNNQAVSLAQGASRKPDSVSLAGGITTLYIPPPVMGQQQQLTTQSLPAVQQAAVSSATATASSSLEASHHGSVSLLSGLGVEGHKGQSDSGMKSFVQTAPPVYPSQQIGTLPQARTLPQAGPAQMAENSVLRFPQQGLLSQAAENMARDTPTSRPQHFPPQSFSPSMLAKSPVPHQQPPSLPETPMTVLERAPKILLSPATLSTASEELIKSLGAHGTIATLPPEPEAPPASEASGTKQDKGSAVEQPAQQSQELITPKPIEEAVPDSATSQSPLPQAPVSKVSTIPQLEAAVSMHQSCHPPAVKPAPSITATQLQAEQQQSQRTGVPPQVASTEKEPVALTPLAIPTTTFTTAPGTNASASPTIAFQQGNEISYLTQTSKLPLTQLVGPSNTSQRSTESHPKADVPVIQPPSMIPKQMTVQTLPALQDSVSPTGEMESVSPSSQVPEQFLHSQVMGLKSNYQPYSANNTAIEKTSKSSPEKSKQLKLDASKPDESEEDVATQQLHKLTSQQPKTTPGPVASFGFPTTPPATAALPVKPTAFSSASSTLVQAQSIMVKTAAMSRTSGFLKGAEQTARSARSRTPPRASLTALPPNTCNNESLGSASALLSSIAKSAWTVTTAMASAAKAKVVPTPKATEKNLTRLRRSPETLPVAGKMAGGERDRGVPEGQAQQSRTPPALGVAKQVPKMPATESSLEASLPSLKSQEDSPPTKSVVRQQSSNLAPIVSIEQAVSTVASVFSAAVGTPLAKDAQQVQCSKPGSESAPAQPLAYSQISSSPSASGLSSAPLVHPLEVASSTAVKDSSDGKITSPLISPQVQQLVLQTTDSHSDVPHQSKTFHGVPSVEEMQKPKTGEETSSRGDQIVPSQCDSNIFMSVAPQGSDNKTPPQHTTPDMDSVPTSTTVSVPMVSSHTSVGEALMSPAVETMPQSSLNLLDKVPVKSTSQHREATITSMSLGSTFMCSAHQVPVISSLSGMEPALAVSMDTGIRNTQPPLTESRKQTHTRAVEEPPAKLPKESLAPGIKIQETQPNQQDMEVKSEPSSLAKTSIALPSQDKNSIGQDALQGAQPPSVTVDISGATEQLGQSEDKQEVLPSDTQLPPREVPSTPEVTRKISQPLQSERIPEAVLQCVSQTSLVQTSTESLTESLTIKSDSSPEPSLLSKPDQITNLVEEAIQVDPDKGSLFEKTSSPGVTAEATSCHPGQKNLALTADEGVEPLPSQLKKTEMLGKPHDKELSKDGAIRTGKVEGDLGDLEPRRTRHTSEEIPGMSTRSLRSGRRSPAEPVTKGKEEESSPTTRGRGQKEKEIPGESEADALSRKRSTRSSGRDMYYGPIPQYKRRKTNQK
ncbi:mucin-5AC-like isoform X2 [Acanthaster planci]|uniref:Mucin-5AC-like isoform X2 n=1 Tax=Acanthaster planci TaxID=133434 RepID=A0A8B7Y491_ACAPL|nr:mucin-5AC-like isoform X2 [Acanthaster planci]